MPESSASGTSGAWFPRWFWPAFAAPATIWLLLLFVVPFYVILSIAFGSLEGWSVLGVGALVMAALGCICLLALALIRSGVISRQSVAGGDLLAISAGG